MLGLSQATSLALELGRPNMSNRLHLDAREPATYPNENNSVKLKFYGTRGSIPIAMPVFSNSAATQPACKSRSPIRTASL
jgi:hypothetical protein